jgi:hypothetical protein
VGFSDIQWDLLGFDGVDVQKKLKRGWESPELSMHNMPPYICHLSVIDGLTDTRNTCQRPLCAVLVLQNKFRFESFFFRIDGIRINFYRGHQSVTPYKMMFLGKSWSWRVWKMNCEVHVDTLKGRCFHSFRDLFGGFS